MITIKEIIISSESDFSKLEEEINNIQTGYLTEDSYRNLGTISEIKSNLWNKGTNMKVIIEYPYYDKEYLNEYSNYYCKKFNIPSNKTFRLIFYYENKNKYELMGYIVLVPTSALNHIGRISFDPKFLIKSANIMLTNCKIHFDGEKKDFLMFPHARQYGLTACGHVSIWAVSKFAASSWDRYSDKDFEQIVNTVNIVNPKTKISPPELTVAQIAGVLSDFGYRPLFKPRTEDGQYEFMNELYSYIDSGIPLVLLDSKYNHALVGIGYQRIKSYQFENSIFKPLIKHEKNNCSIIKVCSNSSQQMDEKKEINVYSDKIFYNSVIINDDNSFPYRRITLYDDNQKASDSNRTDLSLSNLFGFVVPLYSKINIEYSDVKDHSGIIIKRRGLDLGFITVDQKDVYVRIFLAPANKCREHIRSQIDNNIFANKIHKTLRNVELSKLCWVIEYSTYEEQKEDNISGFSILDSTCAFNDGNIVLLNCGRKSIEYFDDEKNEYIVKSIDIKENDKLSLKKFNKNLQHIR